MTTNNYKHNFLAIIGLTILFQILAVIYYLPGVFGQFYYKPLNLSDSPEYSPAVYITGLVGAFVMTYCLSWLVGQVKSMSLGSGLKLGLGVFIAMASVLSVRYAFAVIPNSVIFVDLGFVLIISLLFSIILSVWRRK